jgi:hypothetical protein
LTFQFILKNKTPLLPTFIEVAPNKGKSKHKRGIFKCNHNGCVNTFEARVSHVTNKETQSCGCYHKKRVNQTHQTHGHSTSRQLTKVYVTWRHMLQRCNNTRHKDYKNYGGRGIKVCERWLDFENFFADMGQRPVGKTIDRKDNNKGYYKKNCCWATPIKQANNRRSNRLIVYQGQKITLSEAIEYSECGTDYDTVWARLSRGWSVEKALFKSVKRKANE